MPGERTSRNSKGDEKLVQTWVKRVTDTLQANKRKLFQDAIDKIQSNSKEDVDAIREHVKEIKSSQEFTSAKCDQLDANCKQYVKANNKKKEKLKSFKNSSIDQKKPGIYRTSGWSTPEIRFVYPPNSRVTYYWCFCAFPLLCKLITKTQW